MRLPKHPNYSIREVMRLRAPQTTNLAITSDAYWTILCCKTTLPVLDAVAHPKGEGGAVVGLLAPMQSAAKEDHTKPLRRGIYACASPDRKTVLRLMIMPVDEAGFRPEPFLQSPLAAEFDTEVRLRVGATWHLVQMTFESYDPLVYPSLDLALHLAQRLALLTDGVVADPIALSYKLPEQVLQNPRLDPKIDVREHVRCRWNEDEITTHGLLKFGIPELVMRGVPEDCGVQGASLLLSISQQALLGDPVQAGDQVNQFQVAFDGSNPPRHELILQSGKSWSDALHQPS